MGSIDDCPTAVTYDSADGFVAEIEKALTTPWSQQELDAATTAAKEKADELIAALNALLLVMDDLEGRVQQM